MNLLTYRMIYPVEKRCLAVPQHVRARLLAIGAVAVLLWISGRADASIIWQYQGTLVDAGGDVLGVAGETINVSLTFSDSAIWQDVGGILYVPSIAQSASITGGNTLAHKTPIPAALHAFGTIAAFGESVGNSHFFDFVFNGTTTKSAVANRNSPVVPLAGQLLIASHLVHDPTFWSQIRVNNNTNATLYTFTNGSISVSSTALVPEPSSLALLGAAMVGIVGFRRRRKRESDA